MGQPNISGGGGQEVKGSEGAGLHFGNRKDVVAIRTHYDQDRRIPLELQVSFKAYCFPCQAAK